MYVILKTFLKQREAYIVVNNIATDKFHVPVGLPQDSVFSPILFIFYLSDFLSEVGTKFKFADESSARLSSHYTRALTSIEPNMRLYPQMVQKLEDDG